MCLMLSETFSLRELVLLLQPSQSKTYGLYWTADCLLKIISTIMLQKQPSFTLQVLPKKLVICFWYRTFAHAFVTFRLDYCNPSLINWLQNSISVVPRLPKQVEDFHWLCFSDFWGEETLSVQITHIFSHADT